jgi:hypothetical protein
MNEKSGKTYEKKRIISLHHVLCACQHQDDELLQQLFYHDILLRILDLQNQRLKALD